MLIAAPSLHGINKLRNAQAGRLVWLKEICNLNYLPSGNSHPQEIYSEKNVKNQEYPYTDCPSHKTIRCRYDSHDHDDALKVPVMSEIREVAAKILKFPQNTSVQACKEGDFKIE